MLHIPIVHAHDVSKQIPPEKNFPSGWKCYKTIGSYVSCAFIEIWSTWEVWRALKKLELLSATPRATLTHLSCSPNFPRASYLDEHTLMSEPIVNEYEWFFIYLLTLTFLSFLLYLYYFYRIFNLSFRSTQRLNVTHQWECIMFRKTNSYWIYNLPDC